MKLGGVFSDLQVQDLWLLGEEERVEAFAPAASGEEVLPKTLRVPFGLRLGLARPIHGGVGQTDNHPADHPQHARRLGRTHPAEIFLQRHIQAMMQPALNHPVAALEP